MKVVILFLFLASVMDLAWANQPPVEKVSTCNGYQMLTDINALQSKIGMKAGDTK